MTKPAEITPIFSIVSCLSYVVSAKNILIGPVGPFLPPIVCLWHILRSDYSLPVTKRVQLEMN